MDVFTDESAGSVDLTEFLRRRWKLIAIIAIVTMAAAAAATFFIPKKFLSTGIVFPANNNSVETVIDNPNVGYDIEADRLLQMLQSDVVFDSVVTRFKLADYYGVDKTSPDWRDKLRREYDGDVSFTRTQYMSLVISAETRKPELSADIVNYIIDMADGLRDRIYKRNIMTAYKALEKEYLNQRHRVDTMEKRVAQLRSQTDAELVVLPNSQYVVQVKSSQKNSGVTTQLERTMNTYIYEQYRLNDISGRYEKAKAQFERPVTLIFVLDRAKPSYKKVSPSLTTNMAVAGAVAILFTVFYLLLAERFRREQPK